LQPLFEHASRHVFATVSHWLSHEVCCVPHDGGAVQLLASVAPSLASEAPSGVVPSANVPAPASTELLRVSNASKS
jgi:hypothetical protein